ncbi:MAG: transposase [Thermoplasmata archaeon]|nr:MAG: transposase [Thermoplasmata archaeon]
MTANFDWKNYGKSKEKELLILIREAKKIVEDTVEPWTREHYGRLPYPSRTMVLICILKVYFKMPYRNIEGLLRTNATLRRELNLEEVPDHNTIQRAMEKIPQEYFKILNKKITINFKKRDMTLPSMQLGLA